MGRHFCGAVLANHLIHVHDLGAKLDVDGLLGWDFLRLFNFDVHPQEGRIRLEKAVPRK
jgi:hypothetical protein